MNRKVVIFGAGTFSSLLWYCLKHDSNSSVVSFTVDKVFIKNENHEGLPVVAFEEIEQFFPPHETNMIIPIGFVRINGLRMERFFEAQKKGYDLISYVSGRASIWQDLHLEENTIVYEGAIIQPFPLLGSIQSSVVAFMCRTITI